MPEKERAERHPHHVDVTSAIYGTILVTAVVAVASNNEETGALAGALGILVTTLVFWLAHVYASLLAHRVTMKQQPSWKEVRQLAREEWPLVQAGILPALILLLGAAGLYGRDTAFTIAMWSGVAILFFWGALYARQEGAGPAGMLLSGVFNSALGLVIVVMKALVTH